MQVILADAPLGHDEATRVYDQPAPTRAAGSDASSGAAPMTGLPPPPPRPSARPIPPPPPPRKAPPGSSSVKLAFSKIVAYDPDKDRQRKRGMGLLGITATVAVGAFLALIISFLLMIELGFGNFFVGGILAFMPAPFYVLVFVWLDRFDPEPAWALVGAFMWGSLFSLLVSYILNSMFGLAASRVASGEAANTIAAILSAPPVEEGSKGLGLLLILIFLRREFDGVVDGLVYAGMIALGFATVENVLYYGRAFGQAGVQGAIHSFFLRGVLSPFAHAMFTSLTGIGCGISRESHKPALKFGMPVVGLFFAMSLHGTWNLVASFLDPYFKYVYVMVWFPLFVVFLVIVVLLSVRERRIVKRMLAIEVSRGFLSKEDQALSGSVFRRLAWLISTSGNLGKLRARRRYLRAMVKLGFCYWHVSRANEAGQQTISLPMIPELQAQMKALRAQI